MTWSAPKRGMSAGRMIWACSIRQRALAPLSGAALNASSKRSSAVALPLSPIAWVETWMPVASALASTGRITSGGVTNVPLIAGASE
jgi:hypothetical protein